ncbi:smad nuclear-interacting protein 1-like isoform X2 [Bolinopsis microptera]|uniref:smad nuclear-interacting protein 1-like isoform X2 n=1 Tax=Bolinopsis microptera TaxID=2820187 RepID=UPI003079A732
MGSSRKRQTSTSSSSDSSSSSSDSPAPARSKQKRESSPPARNNRQQQRNNRQQQQQQSSPRRQSFNSSLNNSQNNNSPQPRNTSMKRKRRKEEREMETEDREKSDKKKKDKKDKDRKMKPDKNADKGEDGEGQKKDLSAPNYEKSGKLAEERNTYKGIVIKYAEPQEARIPKTKWRLYPFKGAETLPTMYIHRNSGYLIGRERKIVDIPADHPSCSSQHAVIQFRLVDHIRQDGSQTQKVKPYLMDLESTNGSFLNNVKIEARRYYELKERDIVKFGFSTREYVILHDKTDGVMDTES